MSPAVVRAPKTIRLSPDELAHVRDLLIALPQFGSEAELLAEAARRGLLLLDADVVVGLTLARGGARTALARRLAAALLPVFELLVQEDALPAMLRTAPTTPAPPPPGATAPLSPTVAADLAGLGSGFLDDDEEDQLWQS